MIVKLKGYLTRNLAEYEPEFAVYAGFFRLIFDQPSRQRLFRDFRDCSGLTIPGQANRLSR
ncbi:MAG: hypothetical protein DMG70_22080 [Acidobacteria bacterium]|nr:MAG: hypothetical protein DMG70_22080 [Acidobacteriota bacterium]PYY10002.1 MAG: hypothetical protein DMG69_08300 [Acidobacteriota bacterium]